jgi:hypothetical protein
MSKQHTPGPWFVGRRYYLRPWVVQAADYDAGVATIARAWHEPDAALIAAAPDLLAACEAMISAHDRENEWDANYAIGKMRDAIEKARGR